MDPVKRRPKHDVLLTNEEKVKWFKDRIREREKVNPFDNEADLLRFLRVLRGNFKNVFGRDVPGYFIRKLAEQCGLKTTIAPKTREKMEYAFKLMDENENYRDNKSDLARALELKFGEKTLNYILDDIWMDWHNRDDHPDPVIDIDIHGQQSLFDE